ncbi:MAG TPA: hypothetical protein VIU65_04145, partial [Pyrinomonadaceae bacterium]
RDEGLAHLDDIAARQDLLPAAEVTDYLTRNIAFQMDDDMKKGLQLYFELANKNGLTETIRPLKFI